MSEKITALSFDASQVEPAKPFETIPTGWYHFEISDAETRATKGAKGGTQAAIELTVLVGDYKGRKVFDNINVKNASAQCQEIGQRQLSALCHATGVIVVTDLAAFVGKQVMAKVGLDIPDEAGVKKGYETKNKITGYKAVDGAVASAPGFVPGAPAAPGAPKPPVPPAAPKPPTAPVPPPVAVFPPAGWVAHPSAPGYFWNQATNEVKLEAELKALAPAAPVPPPAPVAVPPPAIVPPPVATFPPVGWTAHPSAPGWFYETANPANMKDEAGLRATIAAPVPPPAPAGVPVPPAPAAGSPPPWKTPAA